MSAIKYKIGFEINAETLFTLVSKLLPVDPTSPWKRWSNVPIQTCREQKIAKVEQLVARKPQIKKVNRRGSRVSIPMPE